MSTPLTSTQDVTVRMFVQRFSATPLGARLARRLVLHQLDTWGFAHGGSLSDRVAVVVAELAANAVTHGRVPGRDFEVRVGLAGWGTGGLLRVDVSDTRGERRPPSVAPAAGPLAEDGRGLALVAAVADRWTVLERGRPGVGKTVRAELDLPGEEPRRGPSRAR